jgi:hypothetical protein
MTQLKVFRVSSYGLDSMHFIVAAWSIDEAEQIISDEGYTNLEVCECYELQTTLTMSCIVERL